MERSMRFFTFLAAAAPLLMGAGFAALPATAADKTLTVYTYDAFTSDWGPGPAIKQAFAKDCGCTREYVALGSRPEERRVGKDGVLPVSSRCWPYHKTKTYS